MSDLFARIQAEFNHRQAEFLNTELATCSRCVDLASTTYKGGNRNIADRQMADAEEAYATVHRLLTDPNVPRHLTIKVVQEVSQKMQELRGRLDALQRISGPRKNLPDKSTLKN